jgi:hypothetical protein
LFRAATVPELPPAELSPRRDRVPLSRPLASWQSFTNVRRRAARRLVTTGFPDAHAEAQLPGSPGDYELPFHEPRPASRSLWTPNTGAVSFRQLHLLRSFVPPANPFTPTRVAPSRRPLLSWSLRPSESLPDPRNLDPPRPESLSTRLLPQDPARYREDRQPSRSGEPSPPPKQRIALVGSLRPPSGPSRTASRRQFLLPWPSAGSCLPT